MDDLIGIVAMIIYFIVLGAAKKSKKKKTKKTASRKREARFEQAFDRIAEAVITKEQGKSIPSVKAPARVAVQAQEGTDPCHEAMLPKQRLSMNLHAVTQEDMSAAGEGEDPCHRVDDTNSGALPEDSPVYRSAILNTEDRDAFAQDILRGVVMSEILSRPVSKRIRTGVKRGA